MLQFGASLTDDTRSVNYDHNTFIIQATGACGTWIPTIYPWIINLLLCQLHYNCWPGPTNNSFLTFVPCTSATWIPSMELGIICWLFNHLDYTCCPGPKIIFLDILTRCQLHLNSKNGTWDHKLIVLPVGLYLLSRTKNNIFRHFDQVPAAPEFQEWNLGS